MPNYVTNEIKAAPHVLAALAGKDAMVDFNAIIPRPACFDSEPMSRTVDYAKIVMGTEQISVLRRAAIAAGNPADRFREGDFKSASAALHLSNVMRQLSEGPFPKDYDDKEFEEFIKCLRCLRETGHAYWFDWCCDKWGTKWNTGRDDCKKINANTIQFITAWSPPLPVIAALAERFPNETIQFRWADEDFGCNVGRFTIRGDKVEGGQLPNDTQESHALAAELIGTENRKLGADGRYEYVEEE